jgi:hypothetical protein
VDFYQVEDKEVVKILTEESRRRKSLAGQDK